METDLIIGLFAMFFGFGVCVVLGWELRIVWEQKKHEAYNKIKLQAEKEEFEKELKRAFKNNTERRA